MDILERIGADGHEQVVMFSDPGTGLKAIIAIHDTTLGPACGGTRMWPYESEDAAVGDVLRLSRAMTYKSAAAGLHLGGGKGVILGDPRAAKSEALLRAYGRFVDTLGGRYITTTDVGTTSRDLECIKEETPHVVGLPLSAGGSGDTAIMTGLGVFMGMRACARQLWGQDSLAGRRIAIQGFGKVASYLAQHLLDDGAAPVATDVYDDALARAREMGIPVVSPDTIYGQDCDIFAPCALGGVLNPETIPQLRCRAVVGAANNQLLAAADGEELHRRGILYAPDYIVNSGGVINVDAERGAQGYSPDRAREKTERIYEIMGEVIKTSQTLEIPTAAAADRMAEQRVAAVQAIKPMHRPCR